MAPYFKFTIIDKKLKGYKKIASLLFVINAIFFIAWALNAESASKKIILFTAAFILAVYAVYQWSYKEKNEKSYTLVYLLIAGIWFTETPYWYFSLLFLILPFLQYGMEKDLAILISDHDIVFAEWTRRRYDWDAFSNIVLKDGLLTLDFTNNRIIQAEPDRGESDGLPIILGKQGAMDGWKIGEDYSGFEKEFNEFCREKLKQ